MRVGDRIPGGYVFVDGSRVGDVGPAVVRERGTLSRDGFISVHVLLDKDLVQHRDPEIITRGYVYKDDLDLLLADIDEAVESVLKKARGGDKSRKNPASLENEIQQALRKMLSTHSSRRPLLFVIVDMV